MNTMKTMSKTNQSESLSGLSRRRLLKTLSMANLGALLGLKGLELRAQSLDGFPSKAMRIVVPQPAGGGFDFVARVMGDKMAQRFTNGVVIENRTGSGTLVGTDIAAKAPADGYTLLLGSVSNMVLNAGLYKNLSYDPVKDFEPLGLAVGYSYTLVARKDAPQKTLAEWDRAGALKTRSSDLRLRWQWFRTTCDRRCTLAFGWRAIDPMRLQGAQAAYTDLMGSRVDLFFDLSSTARVHVDSGQLKAVAVSGPQRLAMHPQVPTLRESGIQNLELESWFGLFASAKTPAKELAVLRASVMEAMTAPEVRERFEKQGGRVLALGAEESRAVLKPGLGQVGTPDSSSGYTARIIESKDMIKHIVMWDILGEGAGDKKANIEKVKTSFESLKGKIPGMLHLEVGVDHSAIDYACDVVLYTEFQTQADLDAYAVHPEHLKVRDALNGLRVARHQVDYVVSTQ
jgi:tripartite-type tricarboxylate transporter receptor subunit TctC